MKVACIEFNGFYGSDGLSYTSFEVGRFYGAIRKKCLEIRTIQRFQVYEAVFSDGSTEKIVRPLTLKYK